MYFCKFQIVGCNSELFKILKSPFSFATLQPHEAMDQAVESKVPQNLGKVQFVKFVPAKLESIGDLIKIVRLD